jgi:hypothetical protein
MALVNRSKTAARSASGEVTTKEIVQRQHDLIRELHELLTTYGPTWYTEEIDLRLSETLAMGTSVTQPHATLVTIEDTRNSNRPVDHTLCWAGWSPLSSLAKTARRAPVNQLTLEGPMIPASQSLKTRIEELRALRRPLWERFESNPTEIQLAAELRIIDDLIADYNEKRITATTKRPNPATAPLQCARSAAPS